MPESTPFVGDEPVWKVSAVPCGSLPVSAIATPGPSSSAATFWVLATGGWFVGNAGSVAVVPPPPSPPPLPAFEDPPEESDAVVEVVAEMVVEVVEVLVDEVDSRVVSTTSELTVVDVAPASGDVESESNA